MKLEDFFDAVVMLTWSDWNNEPRSNRYHYATRFARSLPVLFLQHRYQKRTGISVEKTEIENIDIVNVSCGLSNQNVKDIRSLLSARGIKRPLIWIYDSLNYQLLLDGLPRAYRVYHATEDYQLKTKGWNQGMEVVGLSVVRLLTQVDFMVACTEGVANSYITNGGYVGPYAVIENGCDAEYFLEYAASRKSNTSVRESKVAIFQGGINQRLDYNLILDLIQIMPDWEFHFCGAVVESEGWNRILLQSNVRYFGALPPDGFAERMCDSTVGIIPYIQDQWIRNSLPLKAYEYVACGLPVVSVPITALERDKGLIVTATTAEAFASAIRSSGSTRFDPAYLKLRRETALANSYDKRFTAMCDALLKSRIDLPVVGSKLRVAILYDCLSSMHVNTIREHLESFDKYSSHSVTYIPATTGFWGGVAEETQAQIDLSVFDVAVIHYSVRLSVRGHLDEGVARCFEAFNGLKVLFIQDEYEGTEIARAWMDRFKFDTVYTCVPQDDLGLVYPPYRFPSTEFLPTLTGYVPDDSLIERYAQPLECRSLFIAYRGRKLPAVYGALGFEKYRIGVEMKRIAEARGLPVDIEVDDDKRIYGADWYKFLASSRSTLGTESGANVFDFDGSLKKEIESVQFSNPDISFEEIFNKIIVPHEGQIQMNQISPKLFEAIRLRTALVLFEGDYSGVVRANEHFIPLKKDFSNIDDVLDKLSNDGYINEITSKAYEEVVTSGKWSYRTFIQGFDIDISSRVLHPNRIQLISGPLLFIDKDGALRQALPVTPVKLISGPHPLGNPMNLVEISRVLSENYIGSRYERVDGGKIFFIFGRIWRLIPERSRLKLKIFARKSLILIKNSSVKSPLFFRAARFVWRKLPEGLRVRLSRQIGY